MLSIVGSAGAFSSKNIRLPCHDDSNHGRVAFDASVDVYAFVAEEMNQPSALVEYVAQRIAQRLKHAFPRITSISLQLLKYNLPMGGDADGAGVAFTFIFEE
nr:dihydroneopterin aldolase [uncultured Prevotella sp.]